MALKKRNKWRIKWLMAAVGLLGITRLSAGGVSAQLGGLSPARDPNQVPTARYARGEDVDLSLIVEEWRDRYPATAVFACTCREATCGDDELWPFRTFRQYQPFVALGDFNAESYEENGFNCFDMETGARPR